MGKGKNKNSNTTRKGPRVVKVTSYTNKKGEKTKGHKRTKPDGIEENNHSYKDKKQK